MRGLLADAKHAFRLYRHTPAASLIAVAALAAGMAFVGAFVSLYVDLILRPHPGFEQSNRLATIGQTDGRMLRGLSAGLIERAGEEVASIDAIVGAMARFREIGPDREPVFVELVTRGFFGGLRPRLAHGRGFDAAEHAPDGEPAAVLSHAYWQEEFGGDPDVLGTTLEMDFERSSSSTGIGGQAQPVTEDETIEFRIVGVMGPDMPGLLTDEIALWLPYGRVIPLLYPEGLWEQIRGQVTLMSFARLGRGANAGAVAAGLDARYSDREELYLQDGLRIEAIDGIVRNLNVQRDIKRQLQLFLAGSILLALVASLNVSLFLLARAPSRRRELSIRMAVGAPVKRLARQLASEAGLLVIVSSVLGLLLSIWLSELLRGLAFLRQAEWSHVTLLDWRVLGLVGAFMLLLTLTVSLAPIPALKRLSIAAGSRQVAARATVGQRVAGTLQIAMAGALVSAAIAFAWTLGTLMFAWPGYETRDRFAVQLQGSQLAGGSFTSAAESALVETARRREAIESLPGVTTAAFGRPIPGAAGLSWTNLPHPTDATRQVRVNLGTVDSRFVDTLGLRLLHGRSPTDDDVGVALVNQTFAREFWGRDDVVGESLPTLFAAAERTEVIGVLEDLSFEHPLADVEPFVFMGQSSSAFFFSATALIRGSTTAGQLERQLNGLTDSGALEMSVFDVRPLSELRKDLIAPDRARGLLTIGQAILVVFLAAIGFYGTQRYLVTAGRREYAIRASLGAGPRALGRLVLRRGLLLGAAGLVLGLLLGFIVAAWLRDDFVSRDVSPSLVTIGVAAGLIALLLAASAGPAMQARRTRPAPLLREE